MYTVLQLCIFPPYYKKRPLFAESPSSHLFGSLFQKKLKDDVTSLTSFKHLIWGYNLPTKLTLLNHHTSPGVPLQGWNSTRQINKSRKTRLGFHWLGGGAGECPSDLVPGERSCQRNEEAESLCIKPTFAPAFCSSPLHFWDGARQACEL